MKIEVRGKLENRQSLFHEQDLFLRDLAWFCLY